jgi:serine/threonine protein kinase/tetratricopeptide (TPR) repeat protein
MIGKTISHYKIIENLGSGGMGVVYQAEDTKLKRTVALKFLPPSLSNDSQAKKRFIQEAQAASALDHPNICTIHEIGDTDEGQSFIAMACYDGQSLKDKIKDERLRTDDAIGIIIQIAKGLARAHEEGIVHRDIKPANIMITNRGEVKILDFGLAKLAGQTRLTKTGSTVGTVAYMSPEQATGETVDHRSDIWSLGVVLYEMLTGQLPFKGDYEPAMIYSIINESPPNIRESREDIPAELEQIITRCLAKDPKERFSSVEELLNDFRPLSSEAIYSVDESISGIMKKLWRKRGIRHVTSITSTILLISAVLFMMWPNIAEPMPIAVISFENQTGDTEHNRLSKIIPDLLITNLQRSGNFNVLPWERLNDLKKSLGKDSIEFIDSELGIELCRMEGIPNIVIGSIARVGDIFVTDLKILDVESKEILQPAQSRGDGDNSIFAQIDDLTEQIVTKFGDTSVDKISGDKKSIMEVTTSSLDAYNYFLRGREDFEKGYDKDARKFLEKAIEIDSTFAMAYLYLARTYDEMVNTKAIKANYEMAKEYSQYCTEKDSLQIELYYSRWIEVDFKKHKKILLEIIDKYPGDKRTLLHLAGHSKADKQLELYEHILASNPNYGPVLDNLASWYAENDDWGKAERYLKQYASVSPGDAAPFRSMANIYFKKGMLDEAITKYKEALAVRPDFGSDWILAYIYALRENYHESLKFIDQNVARAPSPGLKALGANWRGFFDFWLGKYDSCMYHFDRAVRFSESVDDLANKAMIDLLKAWTFYELGDYDAGIDHFKSCTDTWASLYREWANNNKSYFSYFRGLVDLKENRVDSAEVQLNEMRTYLREWMPLKNEVLYNLNVLRVEILLAKDSTDKAIAEYSKVSAFVSPGLLSQWYIIQNLNASDVLPRAYIKKGDTSNAILEYERMTTFDPVSTDKRLINPKYHYRLARLYQQTGQREKAIENYRRFLDIWKYADEGVPEKIDAQRRLSALVNEY